MRDWQEYAPRSPAEKPDERFIYSLHHLDYAEYLCREFIDYNKAGRVSMKGVVNDIERFMEKKGG